MSVYDIYRWMMLEDEERVEEKDKEDTKTADCSQSNIRNLHDYQYLNYPETQSLAVTMHDTISILPC